MNLVFDGDNSVVHNDTGKLIVPFTSLFSTFLGTVIVSLHLIFL